MAELQLKVDPRQVTGRQVRALRRQGILPVHLYGKATESLSLQAETQRIQTLLRTAGRNAIIDLEIAGESEARPVVLRGIQRNPVTSELIHIDLFQISLTERLRAEVPLIIVGEAPAVYVHGGVLLQALDHIPVEALPADIPSQIEVDVSLLEELESSVHVRDLPIPDNVEVLAEGDLLVAKVEAPRIAAELEAEAAAAAAAAAEAAPAEEKPAEEGEAPAKAEPAEPSSE
ncbi:MAG: 50S ribosomal protein L25 [Chloroflexi bacterium]|nr:50S ribosomal protein L25 [Chloroflexota bacterium]